MGLIDTKLSNGNEVTLWLSDDFNTPTHGKKLLRQSWDPEATRAGLSFYDSTEEYMRTHWARQHMSPTVATLEPLEPLRFGESGAKNEVLLYFHEMTGTWHSADALDIDHRTPWKEHLEILGVENNADANLAYNDISNLRLAPAPYNRARDSADTIYESHGGDSAKWKRWVEDRFGYDPKAEYEPYDPMQDIAQRKTSTLEKEWGEKEARSGLSFDTAVKNKWFEQELARSYAGTADVVHPETGKQYEVPLFRCAETGQLVTRDAFDIDHQIALKTVLKEMRQYVEDGPVTKAHALDAYNETSNLRLISRAANAGHEFERNEKFEFYDPKAATKATRDDLGFIYDRQIKPRPYPEGDPFEYRRPRGEKRDVSEPDTVLDQEGEKEPPRKRIMPKLEDRDLPVLLSDPLHHEHRPFMNVVRKIELGGEVSVLLPEGPQRENAAGLLLLLARQQHLPSIDHVVVSESKLHLFAVSGPLDNDRGKVEIPTLTAISYPLSDSSRELYKLAETKVEGFSDMGHEKNRHI